MKDRAATLISDVVSAAATCWGYFSTNDVCAIFSLFFFAGGFLHKLSASRFNLLSASHNKSPA